MILLRHLVPAAAALVLGAGCGGPAARPAAEQGSSAPPSATTSSPATVLQVSQHGSVAPDTVWSVRIESMTAQPLAEERFAHRPIALSRPLPAGRYRVVSWSRRCTGPCPASGEKGLGPLEEVCGAVASVVSGRATTAVVRLSPDGRCTVDVQP